MIEDQAHPTGEEIASPSRRNVPILHLAGDHDISGPVENWYALNGQLPTMNIITSPSAGHAPHFQYPEMASAQIAAFIKGTQKV